MPFAKIVDDIKKLKIQGAVNVAKRSADAIASLCKTLPLTSPSSYFKELLKAKDTLVKTRITEPCMRNTLDFIFHDIFCEDTEQICNNILMHVKEAKEYFTKAEDEIKKIGSKKIRSGMVIYTHCHSSTVISILKAAKQQGKNFEVHNTETRPLFQGRKTASELASSGIKVTHYVDSAARLALKKADMMLIGCDAITTDKIFNKIGSELTAELAHRYDIPVYVCTHSWKFDPISVRGYDESVEQRHAAEVWPNAPKNIRIDNHAFENIDPEICTGIISELGVYRHAVFIEEVKRAFPWFI